MSEITDEQFIAAMREVVKGNEDFVYKKVKSQDNGGDEPFCRYIDYEGKPSCLIGQALFKCGIIVPEELESVRAEVVLDRLTDLSPGAQWAADRAQACQDEGQTWGEAFSVFEKTLNS